jgi:tetrahedral aminopeptidase
MAFDFKLLKEMSEMPGIPGYEYLIRKLIITKIKPYVDHIEIDAMGNLIALKKGKKEKGSKKAIPKVMVAAHMDEIGFITSHIEDTGYLRFTPLGGFDPKTLCSQRVVIYENSQQIIGVIGSKPIHVMKAEEKRKVPEINDFYIDIGMDAKEVKRKVKIGTPIARYQNLIQIGRCVTGKSLDNRVCVYSLIQSLKSLKNHHCDLYAVFTTQEEVGIRGARVAAHTIEPDYGIALDVTLANDLPAIPERDHCTRIGSGTAIKVMDRSAIANPELISFFKKHAKKYRIPHQMEVMQGGGTDCSGIQYMSGKAAISGAISIPTRYIHSTTELACVDDIDNTIKLLTKSIENIHTLKITHS